MTTNERNLRPQCPDVAGSVTCEHCIEFLLEYFDGLLSPAEKGKFESHIAICKDCQIYIENYRKAALLTTQLGQTERTQPGDDVPEGLIEAILKARKHKH
jgi:hypothetical protein